MAHETTTADVKPRQGNKKGNTSRQIDYAVDCLFQGYTVVVDDHKASASENPQALNIRLLNKIIYRLVEEHKIDRGDIYTSRDGVIRIGLLKDVK